MKKEFNALGKTHTYCLVDVALGKSTIGRQ